MSSVSTVRAAADSASSAICNALRGAIECGAFVVEPVEPVELLREPVTCAKLAVCMDVEVPGDIISGPSSTSFSKKSSRSILSSSRMLPFDRIPRVLCGVGCRMGVGTCAPEDDDADAAADGACAAAGRIATRMIAGRARGFHDTRWLATTRELVLGALGRLGFTSVLLFKCLSLSLTCVVCRASTCLRLVCPRLHAAAMPRCPLSVLGGSRSGDLYPCCAITCPVCA